MSTVFFMSYQNNRILSMKDNTDNIHHEISMEEQSVGIHRCDQQGGDEDETTTAGQTPSFMSLSDFVGQDDVIKKLDDMMMMMTTTTTITNTDHQASPCHEKDDFRASIMMERRKAQHEQQPHSRRMLRDTSLRTMADPMDFVPTTKLTMEQVAKHEEESVPKLDFATTTRMRRCDSMDSTAGIADHDDLKDDKTTPIRVARGA